MAWSTNGQPPEGYSAPVRQALAQPHLVAGVPRQLLGITAMLCAALWMLSDSYGAIGVFLLLYGVMVYLTKHDPWWPHVWRDYVLLWCRLYPAQARLAKIVLGVLVVMMLILLA